MFNANYECEILGNVQVQEYFLSQYTTQTQTTPIRSPIIGTGTCKCNTKYNGNSPLFTEAILYLYFIRKTLSQHAVCPHKITLIIYEKIKLSVLNTFRLNEL